MSDTVDEIPDGGSFLTAGVFRERKPAYLQSESHLKPTLMFPPLKALLRLLREPALPWLSWWTL